jgi:hypothetical protein
MMIPKIFYVLDHTLNGNVVFHTLSYFPAKQQTGVMVS